MLLESFSLLTGLEFTNSPFRGTNCERNVNNINLIYLNYYAVLVPEFSLGTLPFYANIPCSIYIL